MHPMMTIALKEFRDALRNRWIVSATLLLAGLAFALSFLGSAPAGGMLGVKPLAVVVVSLSSLTVFLLPLIALLLAYDALVGEAERGTLLLLFTYPITRNQLLLGKFLGHTGVILFATVIGYGVAGLAMGWRGDGADAQSGWAFVFLIGSSVVLGAIFIALAYLISAWVRERGTAAGLAMGVWLFFVVLYDLGLLGLLAATSGQLSERLFSWMLLANPADLFRLVNLGTFENVRVFSGLAGLSQQVTWPSEILLASLLAWLVVPLALAMWRFRRVEP
ncbi:MAG: ABC transporter permease [Nitrospirae bacterium]|nr:ABC transporter permease [Magnetococcales bacterium]